MRKFGVWTGPYFCLWCKDAAFLGSQIKFSLICSSLPISFPHSQPYFNFWHVAYKHAQNRSSSSFNLKLNHLALTLFTFCNCDRVLYFPAVTTSIAQQGILPLFTLILNQCLKHFASALHFSSSTFTWALFWNCVTTSYLRVEISRLNFQHIQRMIASPSFSK